MTLIEANSGDHPRINEKGNTIADFNQRIKEIAAAYGLPVIDVHNCGMEVYELNHYTSDGNPSQQGRGCQNGQLCNRNAFQTA